MNQQEKQKRFDFVEDFADLSKDYGWTPDEAMNVLGFKLKTTDDLLLEEAQTKYTEGVVFIPLDKKRARKSSGKVELLCDRIFVWIQNKMFLVYDPISKEWADIIN